tara:strand:+ start:511 stop:858 length:348 start_codon:yes stop_codon:yes gene_type:complete
MNKNIIENFANSAFKDNQEPKDLVELRTQQCYSRTLIHLLEKEIEKLNKQIEQQLERNVTIQAQIYEYQSKENKDYHRVLGHIMKLQKELRILLIPFSLGKEAIPKNDKNDPKQN